MGHTLIAIILMLGVYFAAINFTAPNLFYYVFGNGSLNTAAHGIYNTSDLVSRLGLIKYGFIYFVPALFVLAIFLIQQSKFNEANFALVAAGILIVGLVRFMGRDDPGHLSRPFAGTMLLCIAIFVILISQVRSSKWHYKLGLVGVCGALLANFAW